MKFSKKTEGVSHRSVHFPDTERADHHRCVTMDFETGDKTDAGNSSRTGTSHMSTTVGTVSEAKPQDSYINPNGMVTSEGIISMSPPRPRFIPSEKKLTRLSGSEKPKVRRKRSIDLEDVAAVEMPKCSTPDGEETEVYVRSEGRSPRGRSRSRSHSRANSWSRMSPNLDLEADTRAEMPEGHGGGGGGGGIVSKVMAIFRTNNNNNNNNDEGAVGQTSSMIVSVRTMKEEHVDPVQDPRLDLDLRRWRNLKRASAAGPEDLETGL